MPEFEAPMSGWLEVRIDGKRITRVSAEQGETVEVSMTPKEEKPE